MRTKLIKFFIVLGVVLVAGVSSVNVDAKAGGFITITKDLNLPTIGSNQCVYKRGSCKASNFVSMRTKCGNGGTDGGCSISGHGC